MRKNIIFRTTTTYDQDMGRHGDRWYTSESRLLWAICATPESVKRNNIGFRGNYHVDQICRIFRQRDFTFPVFLAAFNRFKTPKNEPYGFILK